MEKLEELLTADHDVKILRQVRAAYKEAKSRGEAPEAVLAALESNYDSLVRRYSTESWQCPTVRFGRTELQMPIVSLGGMRQQQTWSPPEDMTLDQVGKDCQDNFEAIVDRAMALGINHFETARGYGSSELQFGPVIKKFSREKFILQTKVVPTADPAVFRKTLETSFATLQLEEADAYVDLFAFHGINFPEQLEWIVREGGCMEVVNEYRAAGKIRNVGFSTHGMVDGITEAINTGLFDYVNLHYQFIGSYTATGTGPVGSNLDSIHAARRQDMGVFIISPTDKGGKLYRPSKRFVANCKPLTPIEFNDCWLWNHQQDGTPLIHTIVVGAARTCDLDEHISAAMAYSRDRAAQGALCDDIAARFYAHVDQVMGPGFRDSWYKGLPHARENSEGIPVAHFVWLRWLTLAWGMYEYAKDRYNNLADSTEKWDNDASAETNYKNIFNWVPGCQVRPERLEELKASLASNPRGEELFATMQEVHGMFGGDGCQKTGVGVPDVPGLTDYWQCAYDLQPNVPFPERP